MVVRLLLALSFIGCMKQAQQVMAPEPEGGGTLSCREIVEQCDASCTDPLCLHQCTSQGNQDGQGKHAALLDCGQRNSCTDEACMKASCPTEIDACMGPEPAGDQPAQPEQAPTPTPAT